MKNRTKVILFILLIALFIRVVFLFYSLPIPDWDETVYANLAYDLSKNPFDYSFANHGWSDRVPDDTWPKAGFRPPLLPYLLAVFYFFNLSFLIRIIPTLFSVLSIFFCFLLAEKLFNLRIAFYSSIFLSFLPLHVINSTKIMSDILVTLFIILTLYSFWEGYEKNIKIHKILFGLFFALAVLSKYTALWMVPVFLFYFLMRDKSVKFIFDKNLWISIGVFFIVLAPFLIYGQAVYQNPFGPFFHGLKASTYWGGVQPWNFFILNSYKMLSAVLLVFLFSLLLMLSKMDFKKKQIYLLLFFTFYFLVMLSIMQHKEIRYFLPLVIPLVILSGYFVDSFRYKKILLSTVLVLLIISLVSQLHINFTQLDNEKANCFIVAGEYLGSLEESAFVISDQSTLAYYYVKKDMTFFPEPWDLESLDTLLNARGDSYIFYTEFNSPEGYYDEIKKDLDENFEVVFRCPSGEDSSMVYKYEIKNP